MFLEIIVTSPQKMGDGMGSYVAYKVESKTNIQLYRKRSFSVIRRFSDFLGLHDKLTEKYLRSGRIIPPAPEKSVIGKLKINYILLLLISFFSLLEDIRIITGVSTLYFLLI